MRSHIRKIAAGAALVLGLSGGIVAGTAGPALAATNLTAGDMNIACQQQYNGTGWRGDLSYPNQGVYGWKCIQRVAPYMKDKNIDLNKYCSMNYGTSAYFTNQSDPYSWYCR